jgi:3-phosphoshikimate 1-carboxyvinyltransferase
MENPKTELVIEGEGWAGLRAAKQPLDCGNSGTTMRLLSGALAGRDFDSTLVGDDALSRRPMERVAGPLRMMGANIVTSDGHAPVGIEGSSLQGTKIALEVASSQVKGALLLAGLTAHGETTVVEPDKTRDHTERALAALGAPAAFYYERRRKLASVFPSDSVLAAASASIVLLLLSVFVWLFAPTA